MTAIGPSRVERLATWLGHGWCRLLTGHRYLRRADAGRLTLVCWFCGHESHGWSLAPLSTAPAPAAAAIAARPATPLPHEAIEP